MMAERMGVRPEHLTPEERGDGSVALLPTPWRSRSRFGPVLGDSADVRRDEIAFTRRGQCRSEFV
jgi:hypothetical protein